MIQVALYVLTMMLRGQISVKRSIAMYFFRANVCSLNCERLSMMAQGACPSLFGTATTHLEEHKEFAKFTHLN